MDAGLAFSTDQQHFDPESDDIRALEEACRRSFGVSGQGSAPFARMPGGASRAAQGPRPPIRRRFVREGEIRVEAANSQRAPAADTQSLQTTKGLLVVERVKRRHAEAELADAKMALSSALADAEAARRERDGTRAGCGAASPADVFEAAFASSGISAQASADISAGIAMLGAARDPGDRTRAAARLLTAIRGVGRATDGAVSGQSAILTHLRANMGRVVTGAELEVASGIGDYARRIRDLRADGWSIVGGNTPPDASERALMRKFGITSVPKADYVLLDGVKSAVRRAG